MRHQIWDSATEEIQGRVEDPLLRVEYDPGAEKPYVVTKYFRSFDDYEEQMRFTFWDAALVEKTLKAGRAQSYASKEAKYNRKLMRQRVDAEQKAKLKEITDSFAEDVYQTTDAARVYSSPQRTR